MSQGRLPLGADFGHHRHADRQHRAGAVAAVAGDDPSAQRLDKAAADRQPQPGPGAAPILRLHPIEFIEDALEIVGRYPRPLVDDLDLDQFAVAARPDLDAAAGR